MRMVSGTSRCVPPVADTRSEAPGFAETGACEMDDEVQCQAVPVSQVPGLVAVYRRAVRGAHRLRAGLIAAGLQSDDLTVVAGLGQDGRPVVHVTVLPVLAVQLSALIADDAGPPPRHPYRDDPNVA